MYGIFFDENYLRNLFRWCDPWPQKGSEMKEKTFHLHVGAINVRNVVTKRFRV